jgi:signal transduction histidine kinase
MLARFGRFRGRVLFSGLVTAPLIMPEVITGISSLLFFIMLADWIGWPGTRGFTTITLAHITFSAVFVTTIVQARMSQFDRAIEEAIPTGVSYAVEVRRNYSPAIPTLLGQRGHLSEIFLNLLTNAREAMNGRGKVWIHARVTPDYEVEVRVKDSGPGIHPEHLPKLFDAYFTTKEHGTGLGLAIVKHNAELYGGSVRAESVLGQGATFVVTLPARSVMRLRR